MALIMVFSSQYFIFVFLPAVISLYFLMMNRFKNFFSAGSEPAIFIGLESVNSFILFLFSVALNYAIRLMIVDVKKIKSLSMFPLVDSKFVLLAGIA
jgi:hypothetical protein